MKNIFKKFTPHLIVLGLFYVLSYLYFYPILEGKKIQPHDVVTHQGASKEIKDLKNKTGEKALWTNSMFSGMPTFLITAPNEKNQVSKIRTIIYKISHRPATFVILYLICFYIVFLLFGLNPWLAFIGSIAMTFTSYNFIIIDAGHNSKVLAIAYMGPIIAGVYFAYYKKKAIVGGIIIALFLSLQLQVNHLQITYYTFLIILIFGIFQLVKSIQEKVIPDFIKTTSLLIAAVILALCTNITSLWTTYEYGNSSIRGKSELTFNEDNQTSGLDKDYATDWSYGIGETFTLLVPNYKGGASYGELDTESETYKVLKENNVKEAKKIIKQLPLYWGDQPITSGPVYFGAIIIFLFILGLFIVKGKLKWWLLSVTILSILLAWGRNFSLLTYFFLDYFPGYNKFRTVQMILVMAQFAMPLLGILALKELIEKGFKEERIKKYFYYSLGITIGSLLLLLMFSGSLSYESAADKQLASSGWPEYLIDAFREDRKSMLRSDALRSIVFIILFTGVIALFHFKKIKKEYAYVAFAVIILADLWIVDKRYLNEDDFVSKKQSKNPIVATKADNYILEDKSLSYRVLDLTESTFNSPRASYFHKSIGGYHGAKMRRYQEFIEYEISNNMQSLIAVLQSQATYDKIDSTFTGLNGLNMLNAKYVIINGESVPLTNIHALGNVWFVNNLIMVETPDDEITSISKFSPKNEAIINSKYNDYLKDFEFQDDSTASITLTEYHPNHLNYRSSTQKEQFAVFSEIFYNKGWNAYVDGNPVEYISSDFLLRAMRIPQGQHTIEFRFEPRSYSLGNMIALSSSVLLLLMLFGLGFLEMKKELIIEENEETK